MLVSTHFIISTFIGLGLYPFFGFDAVFFILAGFLIDLDHTIEYMITTKDRNPFNSYFKLLDLYKKRSKSISMGGKIIKCYRRFHIFHSFEFLLVLGFLGFFSKIIFLVFFGFLVHILLDMSQFLYLRIKTKNQLDIGRYYFAVEFILSKIIQKR